MRRLCATGARDGTGRSFISTQRSRPAASSATARTDACFDESVYDEDDGNNYAVFGTVPSPAAANDDGNDDDNAVLADSTSPTRLYSLARPVRFTDVSVAVRAVRSDNNDRS